MKTTNSNKIKVKIQIHATKLKNVAGAFKGTSDPFAVVTLLAAGHNEQPIVLGKTEVIKNTLNPTWTKIFPLDYSLGKLRYINVGVYDKKSPNEKPMGSAMFEIGDILGLAGNVKGKRLPKGGSLYVRVTEMIEDAGELRNTIVGSIANTFAGIGLTDLDNIDENENDTTLKLKLRGVKLKNVEGFMRKSDPFYEISKRIHVPGGGVGWRVHYRSDHIKNNLNPAWEESEIDLRELCDDGNLDGPILFSVFDHERSGRHTPMGSFETTVNALINASVHGGGDDTSKAFTLKKGGKAYGLIVVVEASSPSLPSSSPPDAAPSVVPVPFPDVDTERHQPQNPPAANAPPAAIDNVMSSLPPPIPPPAFAPPMHSSPHAQNPFYMDQKQHHQRPTFIDYISGSCALQMCIAIDFTGSNGDPRKYGTLHYKHQDGQLNDYEKAIVGVGSILEKYDFDKKFPVWGFGAKYGGVIQHCFQVGHKQEADGVKGVLDAYRSVFRNPLTMSGPTVFADCIAQAASRARREQAEAQQRGTQAYTVLLLLTDGSVTDIGMTKSAIMAASDAPLSIVIIGVGKADFSAMQFLDDFSTDRDIVQFVEFDAHKYNKASLTSETLDEIPDQLVKYFYSRGIMPTAMLSESQVNIQVEDFNDKDDQDLSVNFNPDGQVVLNGFEGAYVDDSYEGAAAKYNGLHILPPPSMQPSYQASTYNPSASMPPTSYHQQSNPSAPPMQPSYQASTYNPSASVPPTSYHQQSNPSIPPPANQIRHSINVPAPPPPSAATFRVQVPPGGRPGMKLQIKNPKNGQMLHVVIPQGLGPGDCFGVAA